MIHCQRKYPKLLGPKTELEDYFHLAILSFVWGMGAASQRPELGVTAELLGHLRASHGHPSTHREFLISSDGAWASI